MKVLVCGATGYGNLGDDASRDVIVEVVKNTVPGVQIKTTRPTPSLSLVEWADKVVVGGGGILYDRGADDNFRNYIKYMQWANDMRKPLCLCSVGFQGLEKREHRDRFVFEMRDCRHVSVRQVQDTEEMQRLGIPDVKVGDDIAFLTRPCGYGQLLPGTRHAVIIPGALSKLSHEDWEWLVRELKAMQYRPNVLVMSREDVSKGREVRDLIKAPHATQDFLYPTPSEVVGILSEASVVLSARFHGLVFGVIAGARVYTLSEGYKFINQTQPQAQIKRVVSSRDRSLLAKTLGTKYDLISHGPPSVHVRNLISFLLES